MGLDAFQTSSSSSNGSSGGSGSSRRTSSSKFYRCIWNGKETVSEGYKEVTIEGKDNWQEVLEYIEENHDITEDEFEDLSHEVRYKLVRNAEKALWFSASSTDEITKSCFVCGKTFRFPKVWDFETHDGSTVCPDHDVAEVRKAELDAKSGGK